MAIQTTCPHCDAAYTLADTQRGKAVRCRKCSENFVVGGASDDAPVASSSKVGKPPRKDAMRDSPRPSAKSTPPPRTKPAAVRRDRDDDDEDEDDRPERKPNIKKKSGSSTPMVLMIIGGVVLLLLGCGGVVTIGAFYWAKSATTDAVDNFTQNGQNNPFPPPPMADPNFPNFPNPGDGQLPDLAVCKDVGEALDWVKNGSPDHKKKGAEWLARSPVDDGKRKEVAAELEKLTALPDTKDAGMRALAVWAGPENGPTLLTELDTNKGLWQFGQAGDYVGDALVRIKYAPAAAAFASRLPDFFAHGGAARRLAALGPIAETEVLKYMDSPNNDARDEATKLLRQYGTKPDVMFNQALTDLNSPDAGVQRGACDYLATAPVDEARRAEVAKALEAALTNHAAPLGQPSPAASAAKALKTWGTKDNVVALVDELKRNDNNTVGPCMDALAKLKDERGAEAVAVRLTDFFGRGDAVRALREMGPVAAKAVAAYVNHQDAGVQNEARRLLKDYGAGEGLAFDAMVADLGAADAGQKRRAIDWVANQPVDDAHQKDIARALDKLLPPNGGDPFGQVRQAAAKAEVVWADKDSVPALIDGMARENSDIWQPCMQALGRLKDERAVAPLLGQTLPGKPHIRDAAQALVALGPVVETVLDSGLMNPVTLPQDKITACVYLGADFGTKTSIPALTAALADPNAKVKAAAKAALAAIQKRNP